jgi:hypothetical protein
MSGHIRKRGRGDGTIDQSGEGTWRVRYRINGQRFQKTVTGTKADAQKELRRLLHSGGTGEHITPDKMTLGQWIEHWISLSGHQEPEESRPTDCRRLRALAPPSCHAKPRRSPVAAVAGD